MTSQQKALRDGQSKTSVKMVKNLMNLLQVIILVSKILESEFYLKLKIVI